MSLFGGDAELRDERLMGGGPQMGHVGQRTGDADEGAEQRPGADQGAQPLVDERNVRDQQHDRQLSGDQGLSDAEAAQRLERYGENALVEETRSVVLEFLAHFWAPIPWMIEAALILTAVTGRWADFAIILALLLLNGLVGFWEEHEAAGAIEALKERLATQARVRRDGDWQTIPAEQVVPGDLIAVERGTVIPADGKVLTGTADADESALTGESLPVEKGAGDFVFSGTVVTRGSPQVRVLATGASTMFGRTAELTAESGPTSHFEQAIFKIGRYLIALALALVGVIVVVSLLRGTSVSTTLEFALVVTIASIPVALPAVMSVTMAVGARYLARHEAVVSHLPAVEEMSGVDVLCCDKTGTITRNELTVADVGILADHLDRDGVLREAALTAEGDTSDPIDRAVLVALGPTTADHQVLDLQPFDADRKRAEALIREPDGSEFRVAKGAVQAIAHLAAGDGDAAARLMSMTAAFAEKGYRALAVARADNGEWRISGVLAIEDPPRNDSRETLEQARRLGVEVKMVTGDRIEIARQTAAEVGIGSEILESEAIESLAGAELADSVEAAEGFAQVVPEDKFRIVKALQSRGHIVGMTGDGVNDAPALSRADAGIAVSGATDAARAAADIVLLSPGLSVIVDAIYRAREVFRRMTNYAIYRITETIRIVLFVTLSIVAFAFFPVTPIQIVLLAILNDAAILTIAYDRVQPSARPERWDLREVLTIATVLGLGGVVESFSLVGLSVGPLNIGHDEVQTLMYLKLSVAGHLTLFVARTRGRLWSYRPAWILLIAVIGTQLLATAIAVTGVLMEPLRWQLAALAWGYALLWILLLDQIKLWTYDVLQRRGEVAAELGAPPRGRGSVSLQR
jgi:H+-transporting ATPase